MLRVQNLQVTPMSRDWRVLGAQLQWRIEPRGRETEQRDHRGHKIDRGLESETGSLGEVEAAGDRPAAEVLG